MPDISGTDSPACRLCGSTSLIDLGRQRDWLHQAKASRDGRRQVATLVEADPALTFDGLVECTTCGFRSVARIPPAEALAAFYERYHANAGYASKATKKIARAKRWIARLGQPYGQRRFLDVGCNQGFAVAAAAELGWTAHGIDVDSAAIDYAKATFPELSFEYRSAADLADSEPARFDLVYCSEVIEHVPDFAAFLAHLAELVSPQGRLFLTTPDAGHWRIPTRFIEWSQVKPPEHINYFQRKHIRDLLRQCGLTAKCRRRLKPGMHIVAQRSERRR